MDLFWVILMAVASGALAVGITVFFTYCDPDETIVKIKLPSHGLVLGFGTALISGAVMWFQRYDIYIMLIMPIVAFAAYTDGMMHKAYDVATWAFFLGSLIFYLVAFRDSAIPIVMAVVLIILGYSLGKYVVGRADGVVAAGMILAIACVCDFKVAGWILLLLLSQLLFFGFATVRFFIDKKNDKSLKYFKYKKCFIPSLAIAFGLIMILC